VLVVQLQVGLERSLAEMETILYLTPTLQQVVVVVVMVQAVLKLVEMAVLVAVQGI
jgi:hypothetical protein